MRPIFVLFLLALAIVACRKNADQSSTANTTTAPALHRDSLRRVYESLVKTKAGWMPVSQVVAQGKLYPVDEALLDTAFFVFRENLLKAIRQKDEFYLLEITDEQIENGFGLDAGFRTFVEGWRLDKAKDSSEIWDKLKRALAMGGVFNKSKTTFTAPYFVATFPKSYDAEIFGAITGEGVRVRAAPNANSQILKTISYDVVQLLEYTTQQETINGETFAWVKIKLPEGKEGFVFGKFFGSPSDASVTFTRQADDTWKMTAFVGTQ